MKKILSLLFVLGLVASCAGYTPLYGELGGQMNEIGLKEVKMLHNEKDIGERRIAQYMYQKLSIIFINNFDNDYDLYVELDPSESAIATRSDATDKRKSISITAKIRLKDVATGKTVLLTSVSRSSSYTVQAEPFATQAARDKALQSITSSLSGDIVQCTALWFRGYTANEDNK